jgi:hypothetical protein
LVLVITIAVLSTVVGLHSVVSGVIVELGDIGTAIGHANQSLIVTGFGSVGTDDCPWKAKTEGWRVVDEVDVCDDGGNMHKNYVVCDFGSEMTIP